MYGPSVSNPSTISPLSPAMHHQHPYSPSQNHHHHKGRQVGRQVCVSCLLLSGPRMLVAIFFSLRPKKKHPQLKIIIIIKNRSFKTQKSQHIQISPKMGGYKLQTCGIRYKKRHESCTPVTENGSYTSSLQGIDEYPISNALLSYTSLVASIHLSPNVVLHPSAPRSPPLLLVVLVVVLSLLVGFPQSKLGHQKAEKKISRALLPVVYFFPCLSVSLFLFSFLSVHATLLPACCTRTWLVSARWEACRGRRLRGSTERRSVRRRGVSA